jgi:hypothetical protein
MGITDYDCRWPAADVLVFLVIIATGPLALVLPGRGMIRGARRPASNSPRHGSATVQPHASPADRRTPRYDFE